MNNVRDAARCAVLATAMASALAAGGGAGVAQEAGAAKIAFWNSVADSQNPDEPRAYLALHPDGVFSGLARLRLSRMGGEEPAAPAVPESEHDRFAGDAFDRDAVVYGPFIPANVLDAAIVTCEADRVTWPTFPPPFSGLAGAANPDLKRFLRRRRTGRGRGSAQHGSAGR